MLEHQHERFREDVSPNRGEAIPSSEREEAWTKIDRLVTDMGLPIAKLRSTMVDMEAIRLELLAAISGEEQTRLLSELIEEARSLQKSVNMIADRAMQLDMLGYIDSVDERTPKNLG